MPSTFKIRRKSDGLFSTGGCLPSFSKTGKTWTKATLNQHLSYLAGGERWAREEFVKKCYSGCEIVELVVVEASAVPVLEYNEARKARKK
jgi:hypothetical protein